MTTFLKSAKQIIQIEENETIVEIKYDKYLEGFGFETFTDYFKTTLSGTSNKFVVSNSNDQKPIRYEQFLDTMVNKTTDTRRKMISVQLENVLCENKNTHSLIRIMNTVKILDPTFIPPYINVTCSWQKRMVREFCLTTFPKVINSCTSDHRLDVGFRVLQLIESELQL
jgi:hypothetical protein